MQHKQHRNELSAEELAEIRGFIYELSGNR